MLLLTLVILLGHDKLYPKRLRWSVRIGGASAMRIDLVAADFFLQLRVSISLESVNSLLAVVFVIAVKLILVAEDLEQVGKRSCAVGHIK